MEKVNHTDMANKEKCDICGKIATWIYMPGNESYCDDCVPRGCSCNVNEIKYYNKEDVPEKSNVIFWNQELTKWTKEVDDNTFFFEIVDENYRREPCCEYGWSEDGFEIED